MAIRKHAPRRSLPPLGELERSVLARLWSHGPADVRRIHRAVGEPRGITPNTVQSALDRLFRKELAERRKVGRAYRYEARISRADWVARCLEEAVGAVPGADPEVVLAAFVDLAARAGEAQLAVLERMVRERRRRGGEDEP